MYMFPLQFGLHNVFTSKTNTHETVQSQKDYTLREEEIEALLTTTDPTGARDKRPSKIPKRLRGEALSLVHKLRILHSRCAYRILLDKHCPRTMRKPDIVFASAISPTDIEGTSSLLKTQQTITAGPKDKRLEDTSIQNTSLPARKLSLLDAAVPDTQVAAFCCAVITRLVPKGFLGTGDDQVHNHKLLLDRIDRFVRMRRFESLSLHEVVQGMKVSQIILNATN